MSETASTLNWVENTPILLWRAVRGRGCTWVGRQWIAYTGLSLAQSLGQGWLAALHPDDRTPTLKAFAAARDDAVQCDHRIRGAAGDYRWHRTRASRGGEWEGASVDIEDLHQGRKADAAELAESRRRLRNSFGVLRSIARRTVETSENVESYAMHFEGRLDALARVEGRIAHGGGVALETLVAEEIDAFLAREDGRLTISGPPLVMRTDAAEILALLFHELATNAVKFGALSPLGGRLEISWELQPGTLRIAWTESGVPLKGAPRKDGFGAELVKRGLSYRLRARTEFTVRPDGLACIVEVPLGAIAA